MLTLTRKRDEKIIIKTDQGDIEILVSDIRGNRVRIGVEAPKNFKILRGEHIENTERITGNQTS